MLGENVYQQVSQIDDFISQFRHQTLDTPKLAMLSKLIREAKLAMTNHIILNETNKCGTLRG